VSRGRPKRRPLPISPAESAQLRRLVDQAWDLRDSPYMVDACRAIEEWAWRMLPDWLERQAEGEAP
jgi:hypothetical protein